MKFIPVEKLLSQTNEVQQVFIDNWKPTTGDLIYYKNQIKCICEVQGSTLRSFGDTSYIFKNECTPLLTEYDLRTFIEDTQGVKVSVNFGEYGYQITLLKYTIGASAEENEVLFYKEYNRLSNDLLDSYWHVALDVATLHVS